MSDGLIIMFLMALVAGNFGYYSFMVWFRVDDFREKIIKRNVNHDMKWPFAKFSKGWMSSQSYIWFIRILLLLGFLVTSSIFLLGLWGYLT